MTEPSNHENEDSVRLSDAVRQQAAAMRARDTRGRRSMDALLRALLELLDECSFEKITVEDIAARAGIGRSTFYRHFASKDSLMEAIAKTEIEQLVDLAVPLLDGPETLASSLQVARYVDQHRSLWSILLTGGAAAVMRQRFVELAQLRGASHTRHSDVSIPLDLGTVWGVAATIEILAWWLRQPEVVSVEQVAEFLDRLAVRPALDSHRR